MPRERSANGLYVCPCCGYASLAEAGRQEICAICYWQDDGQDDPLQNDHVGGPNELSLAQGRLNFLELGASDPRDIDSVRQPVASDINVRKYALEDGVVVRATDP